MLCLESRFSVFDHYVQFITALLQPGAHPFVQSHYLKFVITLLNVYL